MKRFIERLLNWEQWPFALLYAPIAPIWGYFMLRSRAVWFFTPSNPTITFGGFEGEGKQEMYAQLPPHVVPKTIYIEPHSQFTEAQQAATNAGLKRPFIVKPEVGMKGILFRKIDRLEQWIRYHEKMPATYLVQEMIDYPLELSVFYYRHPAEQKGHISGFILKELLQVVGDGKNTLWQLILAHPRAKLRAAEMQRRHENRLGRIIPEGQVFFLSYAANHNRGARFINLKDQIDEQLLAVFDEISHYAKHFYYGRYDIKCASIEHLKAGKEFYILEYNGSGAEPNHIYDAGISLWQAYKEIIKHWHALYRISKYNHQQGFPYWSFRQGLHFLQASNKHFKQLAALD